MTEPILMSISEWIERRFTPGSAPHPRTVRGWIDSGDIPGIRLGRNYFVDIHKERMQTGDPTVDYILQEVEAEREERRQRRQRQEHAQQVTT